MLHKHYRRDHSQHIKEKLKKHELKKLMNYWNNAN